MCIEGALRAGHELLAAIPDPGFRCYYVWLPVLMPDNEAATTWNESSMKRRRARHYWDADLGFSRHMASALGVSLAWDMYLLYGRGAQSIEKPAFWMHQIETDLAPRLDVEVLRREVEALLAK